MDWKGYRGWSMTSISRSVGSEMSRAVRRGVRCTRLHGEMR